MIRKVNLMALNHLEIKHLRMISSIAETGNMTRATEDDVSEISF